MKTMKKIPSPYLAFSALALSAFVFSGCGSRPDYEKVNAAWATGDVRTASLHLKKDATEKTLRDSEDLLWILDAGIVSGLNGDYAESEVFLDIGSDVISNGFLKEEKKSVLDTLTAAAKNLVSATPYEARTQEAVSVPVLQIYNALGDGDSERACARATELMNVCNDAVEINSKRIYERIEKSRERQEVTAGSKKGGYDPVKEVKEDKVFLAALKEMYGNDCELDFERGRAQGVYANPFAYWLGSVIRMNAAENRDDFEIASQLMRLAYESCPCPLFEEELRLAEACAACEDVSAARENVLNEKQNVTYVVYEGGRAPRIGAQAVKMSVPAAVSALASAASIAVGGPAIPTTGTAYMPVVESFGDAPEIKVAGGTPNRVFDLDYALDDALFDELEANTLSAKIALSNAAIARAVAVVGARVALDAAKQKNANAFVQTGLQATFVGVCAAAATEPETSKPDPRTWTFLPRSIDLFKIRTPENGVVEIFGEEISVPAQGVNLIRVRKVDEYWPALVQVFPLNAGQGAGVPAAVKRLPAPPRPDASVPVAASSAR